MSATTNDVINKIINLSNKKELTLIEMLTLSSLDGKTYVGGDICYNSTKGFYWRGSKEPFVGSFEIEEFNNPKYFTWVECPDEEPISMEYRNNIMKICGDLLREVEEAITIGDCVYAIDNNADKLNTYISKLTRED